MLGMLLSIASGLGASLAPGEVREPVGGEGDDGYYNGGFFDDVVEIVVGNDGTARKGYLLFDNVPIPQGAIILSARIDITASQDANGTTVNLVFVAADEDEPTKPTDAADAESRPRTSASVEWNNVAAWTQNETYASPDLSPIIQELVERAGWGQAILMFMEDNGSSPAASRKGKSYKGDPAKAAILIVTYEVLSSARLQGVVPMTKIVAANDALATSRAKADYLCDGTADDVQIQAAHDALPAGGGAILLTEGTYNLSTTVTLTKPTLLIGEGYATYIVSAINGDAFYFSSADGSKAQSIRLQGPTSANAVGLHFDDCDFLEVSSTWIRNFGYAGIRIEDCGENTRIVNNNIDMLDGFVPLGVGYGIHLDGQNHDVIISENHLEGWKYGIVSDDWTDSADLLVRGNGFDDQETGDVYLVGFCNVGLVANEFNNCLNASGFSVEIDYENVPDAGAWKETAVMVTGNLFCAMDSGGVHITNGVGHTITGNVFQSVEGQPVLLDQVATGNYSDAHGVTIANNTTALGQTTSGGRSKEFRATNFDRVTMIGNALADHTGEAIILDSDQAIIANNTIKDANSAGAGAATEIISLTGQNCIVQGNSIIGGAVTDSILEEAGSDYNMFLYNLTDDGTTVVGAHSVDTGNVEV